MLPISAPAATPSYFGRSEGTPSPLHCTLGELVNWCSYELHSFFGTSSNTRAPTTVFALANNSKSPVDAHIDDPQRRSKEFATFATAIIPLSGYTVPTRVTLTLVPLPLDLGIAQYPSPLDLPLPDMDQGGDYRPSQPLQPSEQSQLSEGCSLIMDDMMEELRYPEYIPTPGSSPITPQNPIPGPDICYDYRPSRALNPMEETILDSTSVTSPRLAVCPPPFDNPTPPGTYPQVAPGYPLSSSVANRTAAPAPRTTCKSKNEESGQPTYRQLRKHREIFETFRGTPTSWTVARPTRGGRVDQRHPCSKCNANFARPSGLNRHYKDKHSAWMTCTRCRSEFSWGRMYKFTEHLQTCPGA